jgi:MFS family permease
MRGRFRAGFLAWREASLTPLSISLFRALWTATLASNIGAVIQTVGAQWTMTLLAPSPQMVALVSTAAMLPIVLLALPAGALADNVDRRALMLVAQVTGTCAAALLAALSFTDNVTPITLLALTAVIGATVALHQPAWQASIGDFVPRKDIPAAVSLNVIAFNGARSIGPAIGGAIIAVAGPSVTFLLNAISFLGLIVVLATRPLPRAARLHPPEPILAAMTAGVRFVGMSPPLRRIFLRGSVFALGASALQSLLPLLARTRLGGPMSFGATMGALGLGSFLGAMLATHVRANIGGNRMLALATVVHAGATVTIAFSTSLALSMPLAFIAGASWIFVFTTTRTAIQLASPRWVVGRAVATGQVASFGCMAIGSAAWGAIAGIVGLPNALAIAAGFLALSVLLHRVAPLPVVEAGDASGHAPVQIRAPRVALDESTGPIVVIIEYCVPVGEAREFLRLMTELGRARRRNGATEWSLQQDIDRPEVWLERIESSTWTHHVRRLDRYTTSERALAARVAAFRTTNDRPVRRLIVRPAGSAPLTVSAPTDQENGSVLADDNELR